VKKVDIAARAMRGMSPLNKKLSTGLMATIGRQ
jgi:hypothetical protein